MNATASTSSPARRVLLAVSAALGPVLLAVGTALDPVGRGSGVADYLSRLSAAPVAYLVSGLTLWAGMALLPVTAAIVLHTARSRPRSATLRVGAVSLSAWGVLGATGVAAGYTAGWVAADIAAVAPQDVVDTVFLGITYGPWGTIGGAGGGVAWVLAMLLIGIGAIVARGVPAWAGVAVLVAFAVTIVGASLDLTGVTASGFLVLAAAAGGLVSAVRGVETGGGVAVAPAPRAADLVE